ncbi:MAG: BatA domain-containing protein [Alphaproteobacteria bacterium]|nr:BatA domain-containing protein [Alphaproteobacteria bacterium]MBU2378935.1 BatA domain-containing protein [Alphaproteobacteria bacterium]
MTPALLFPAGLAALLAVAIPIVIHIARRTESRTIDFAALRWLDPQPKPRRSLMIDERRLLAVRLLLLALIALWLAKPVLWNFADRRPVVAVAPGITPNAIAEAAPDGARTLWLAPGFPATGGPSPSAPANLISLIRQLDADLPTSTPVTILVPATLTGVDAERPRLSRRVDWRVGAEIDRPAPPAALAPPALTVRYSAGAEPQVRYFRAAATAWTAAEVDPAFDAATVERPVPRDARYLVWLAAGPLPPPVVAWVRAGGVALTSLETRAPVESETTVVWRDPAGEPLALAGRLGQGRVIRMTRPLQPSTLPQLVEPEFPAALADMLTPSPPPSWVASAAHAPLVGAEPYDQPPFDLRPWLALIIGLVFAGERWMATRRRRTVGP